MKHSIVLLLVGIIIVVVGIFAGKREGWIMA